MRENREQDFASLSEKANECLERPVVELPHHKLLLRLWHYPSFDRHASWLLYSPLPKYDQIAGPIVVRCVWDQVFDRQRFGDPMKGLTHGFSAEPSMSLRQSEVSGKQLESRLAALAEIALPPFVDDASFGTDGESLGIETFGFKTAVSFKWWCEGSDEWKSLISWAKEFRYFLDKFL